MILVDVLSPVLDEVYDFELEEEAGIEEVLEEMLALIGRKEKVILQDGGNMQLYALRQESLLDKRGTLKGQGVEAGDRLILL